MDEERRVPTRGTLANQGITGNEGKGVNLVITTGIMRTFVGMGETKRPRPIALWNSFHDKDEGAIQ